MTLDAATHPFLLKGLEPSHIPACCMEDLMLILPVFACLLFSNGSTPHRQQSPLEQTQNYNDFSLSQISDKTMQTQWSNERCDNYLKWKQNGAKTVANINVNKN